MVFFNRRGRNNQRKTSGNFSEKEKRAYDAGKAYAEAKKGKRVHLNTKKERDSFRAGVKSVK